MYSIQVIAGVILAALCIYLEKKLMIVLTSLIGSILVTFYFGFMIKVLPDFTTMFNRIKNGDLKVSLSVS